MRTILCTHLLQLAMSQDVLISGREIGSGSRQGASFPPLSLSLPLSLGEDVFPANDILGSASDSDRDQAFGGEKPHRRRGNHRR